MMRIGHIRSSHLRPSTWIHGLAFLDVIIERMVDYGPPDPSPLELSRHLSGGIISNLPTRNWKARRAILTTNRIKIALGINAA